LGLQARPLILGECPDRLQHQLVGSNRQDLSGHDPFLANQRIGIATRPAKGPQEYGLFRKFAPQNFDYARPEFRRHLLGGIQSVVREAPLDYTRAYATSPADEPRKR
jgi:hypothetical protein